MRAESGKWKRFTRSKRSTLSKTTVVNEGPDEHRDRSRTGKRDTGKAADGGASLGRSAGSAASEYEAAQPANFWRRCGSGDCGGDGYFFILTRDKRRRASERG